MSKLKACTGPTVSTVRLTRWDAINKTQPHNSSTHELTWKELYAEVQEAAKTVTSKTQAQCFNFTTNTDGHRRNSSTVAAHAILLDYDGGGTGFERVRKELNKLNMGYILYHTNSATPEKPKWRLILPLSEPFDTTDPRRYRNAYFALIEEIAALSGIPVEEFDAKCATLSQGFYPGQRETADWPERETAFAEGYSIDLEALLKLSPPTENTPKKMRPNPTAFRGLSAAAKMQGWLGDILPNGNVCVRCPNNTNHTAPLGEDEAPNSSTIIFPDGGFYCSHAHCQKIYTRDLWIALGVDVDVVLSKFFRVCEDASGHVKVYYINDLNEAIEQGEDRQRLKSIVQDILDKQGAEKNTIHGRRERIEAWINRTPRIPEPDIFGMHDENNICLKRLAVVPRSGLHPAWDEFLERCDDEADVFKAYVGSILDRHNFGRQALWLVSNGEDGKSVVLDVLHQLLGSACFTLTGMYVNGSRFVLGDCVNKRLIIYPECLNDQFATSNIFRSFLSGDTITAERKGKDATKAHFRMKLIIGSNKGPQLSSSRADRSRILIIKIAPAKSRDSGWKKRLELELPEFIYDCIKTYNKLCPDKYNIEPTENIKARIEDAFAMYEGDYFYLLDKYFILNEKMALSAQIMTELIKNAPEKFVQDNNFIAGWKDWLERRGVRYVHKEKGRYYLGIELKNRNVGIPVDTLGRIGFIN